METLSKVTRTLLIEYATLRDGEFRSHRTKISVIWRSLHLVKFHGRGMWTEKETIVIAQFVMDFLVKGFRLFIRIERSLLI